MIGHQGKEGEEEELSIDYNRSNTAEECEEALEV
jgi:hypothetical protein